MTGSLHTAKFASLVRLMSDARKERGLTQQEIANRLGKPQSYVAKLEGNERRLDVLEFVAFAKALEINPAILFARLLEALERQDRDGA